MRPEDVLHWLQAVPFVPSRVKMNIGLTFDVRHPELVRLWRTTLMYFTPPNQEGVYDRFQMFGLVLIESIEPIDVATSNAGRASA